MNVLIAMYGLYVTSFLAFYRSGIYSLGSTYLYILLVVPAFILALIAQIRVKSVYSKYSKVFSRSGYTGQSAAFELLRRNGVTDVSIGQVAGTLSDHFNPRTNVINLSEGIFNSNSVAAIGIACHEAGHALQHAQGYKALSVRDALVPVCNIGSYLGIPLAFVGYWLGFDTLIIIGLALYSLIALFQLVTLPVEFNASRRALELIDDYGLLSDDERAGARKVLSAAAMTYVASLAVTLGNLLRFIVLFLGGRRKN